MHHWTFGHQVIKIFFFCSPEWLTKQSRKTFGKYTCTELFFASPKHIEQICSYLLNAFPSQFFFSVCVQWIHTKELFAKRFSFNHWNASGFTFECYILCAERNRVTRKEGKNAVHSCIMEWLVQHLIKSDQRFDRHGIDIWKNRYVAE